MLSFILSCAALSIIIFIVSIKLKWFKCKPGNPFIKYGI